MELVLKTIPEKIKNGEIRSIFLNHQKSPEIMTITKNQRIEAFYSSSFLERDKDLSGTYIFNHPCVETCYKGYKKHILDECNFSIEDSNLNIKTASLMYLQALEYLIDMLREKISGKEVDYYVFFSM